MSDPNDDEDEGPASAQWQPNRREVIGGAAATAVLISGGITFAQEAPAAAPAAEFAARMSVHTSINGTGVDLDLDPRTSLLDAVREQVGLFGTKKGCDHGQCGACTVHLDGRRVLSCLTPAVQVADREITTIEGLAVDGELHPMQTAFIEHDALQCGYCTSGQIMSAVACVNEGHAGTPDQVREYMSGNLCRCGAYQGIVEAIMSAKTAMEV